MTKEKDLTGMVFGSLTALMYAGSNKHGQATWVCDCACGKRKTIVAQSLLNGDSTTCGMAVHRGPTNYVHGMKGTLIYGVWNSMKNRCTNPKVAGFKNYGGRGVKVCDRWHRFENFYADMGDRPSDNHSIERRDNDGDYSPENCYWADKATQSSNKRNTRLITANGETLHLAEWARRLGCNPAAILARLATGMPEAEAVTKPIPARPNSRLTDIEAAEIRNKYPGLSAQKLADLFRVSKKTVLNVIHGKTFADLH